MNEAIDILRQAEKVKSQALDEFNKYARSVSKLDAETKKQIAPIYSDINKMVAGLKTNDVSNLQQFADQMIKKYADQNSK